MRSPGIPRSGCAARAVFFDCGSTLIDPDPSVAEMFVRIANGRGCPLTLDDVRPHMRAAFSYYDMRYLKDSSFWASPRQSVGLWYDIYRLLCHLTGFTDDVEGVADEMYRAYLDPGSWAVYDGVIPCLETLKSQGCRLAVISNWDPTLPDLLEGLGLAHHFDVILASGNVRCHKPERHIFETAMDCLGVAPDECLHVGDKIEADGDAAAFAGIRAVLIDHRNHYAAGERAACPYPVIDDLRDVPRIASGTLSSE